MNPNDFLRCSNDAFTQVRNERGELLGVIPRLAEHVQGIRGTDGQPYLLRVAAVSMLCVPNDCNPAQVIPGFIPMGPSGPGARPTTQGSDPDLALPPHVTE